ncbi:hypothetical protein [Cellulosilyticum sp. I15G10I2]|uniref:hypothetical protein n=1 Tax=Cellulosilyticum sp. I15G10I2 TaxID=1892843 RepID=UPI0009F5ABAB|nr:hypothetical protein [Cellulosilyticum sp. I15G10I2]
MHETTLGEELDFLEDEYEIDDTNNGVEPMPIPTHSTQLNAWTSLILGIVGSLGWLVPIIGLPVTIVGTVLGAVGIKTRNARGIAIAGFVINTVFLIGSIAKGILDIIKYIKKSNKD